MYLFVGLGNFPKEYDGTRHNIGFLAVDSFAQKEVFSPWTEQKKFFGKTSEGSWKGEKVILLKPETFMNLSGKSVSAVANFYKIPPEKIWVLFDDLDLPFGTIRFRKEGSSGGHNGIKSMIESLGSDQFPRIKFGIANELREKIPAADFVLQRFSPEEKKKLPEILSAGIEKLSEHIPSAETC